MYVSFYASVVFQERARLRMREQRAAADRRKRRIRLVAFGGGLVICLASIAAAIALGQMTALLKNDARFAALSPATRCGARSQEL